MAILGTGIDIVENYRLKEILLKKKSNFKKRIFTINEVLYCEKKSNSISCYAKRFAAKEAFAKALGIGFRKNINFKDIEVVNNTYGKPYISINKKIANKIRILFKVKKFNILLSISDEKKYSIASVIISK
ncbi:MAG: holo-ACP synthase [Pelagibacteraceae bacterium]|jgi:holo-[acyl-carrier protein] synthase|nr:holo-ACP synthase [Pelagibacteraceae bacterium]